ncbi:carbohydrate ABC transporter membrane protein 1, CUT1 family [Arthrobacter sp. ok909]|uniref:carbohydrate ABC transporter permease n=1 Tax=Arthrobacter sp. ok909 TaxID=1761746 RepID=UPI00088F6D67|nr:sugar ABC transporter permease [Arthrobacter sp. ok909]SDP63654.1 carbohydrate ABC transporter membrane protein 1, CUT1 family [Arthrobacter sp. ok909]
MRIPDRRFALFLMTPAAVFLAVFVAYPLIRLITDSFYKISPNVGGTREFIGLANYVEAFSSEAFTGAGWRTLAYTTIVVTLEFSLGLGMALLFTMLGKRSQIWRTVFLYPLMIAPIVAGLLWKFLMADNFGLVGTLLYQAGILQNPNQIGWLSNPDIVLFSVAIPDIWLTTSFMCLVLFAGLQNIPGDLIEAARLDGAKAPALLFRIILPLLRPVIAVALVVRGIDAARAFDTILIQTNGGPDSASETMSLLIYRTMIRFGDPGLASAMGTIYLLAMLAIAFFAVAIIWRPGKDI